ncbi:unnamed protein product, partial [Lepidochelys kempii]
MNQSSAASNKKSFWQVVSCSEGSAIKVWDLQNGQLVTEVYEAHGHATVTCMALDTSGKRLITGGRDGSLKKWDCSAIRYIHTLKQAGISNDEVTSCTYADIYSNRDLHSEASEGPCPQMDWIDSVSKDRSTISDMAVCDDDCLLRAADHMGYIYVWNITKYALQGPEEETSACEQHFLLPLQSQCPFTLSHVADSCI